MPRKFKRLYLELSNQCNRKCHFCPTLSRSTARMDFDFFETILPQISERTQSLFFHVMGEPLLHPDFARFVEASEAVALPVNITTNGTLLNTPQARALFAPIVRQINFSLHGLLPHETDFLEQILNFTRDIRALDKNKYINFRLWNDGTHLENRPILESISTFFDIRPIEAMSRGSVEILPRLYVHFETPFVWPKENAVSTQTTQGYCLGLIDQIAVLADGTVIPCCLDCEGEIALGNLHHNTLKEIIQGSTAQAIIRGFKQGKAVHPLCQKCTYRHRFDSLQN